MPTTIEDMKDAIKALKRSSEIAMELKMPVGGDYHYYKGFPALQQPLAEGLAGVHSLLEACETSIRRQAAPPPDWKDPDEVVEWVTSLMDDALEGVDSALDAFKRGDEATEGVAGGPVTQSKGQQQTGKKAGTKSWSSLQNSSNTLRPQDAFKTAVDNSTAPFQQRLAHLVGLAEALPDQASLQARLAAAATSAYVVSEAAAEGRLPSAPFHPFAAELESLSYHPWMLQPSPPTLPLDLSLTPLLWVDSAESLATMVAQIKGETLLAVDLEAHSYRSFQGFTCLMQLSTRTSDYLVDTLTLREEIGPALAATFADPAIVKVFHGSDHDVVWLQRDLGLYLVNMFDTGQAARVLSYPSAGLAYLLEHHCAVKADKRYQLADWRVRPLAPELLAYARCDTHYLLYIYDLLKAELALMEDSKIPPTLAVIVPSATTNTTPASAAAPSLALTTVLERSRRLCLSLYAKEVPHSASAAVLAAVRAGMSLSGVQMAAWVGLRGWRDNICRQLDESAGCVLPKAQLESLCRSVPATTKEMVKALGRNISEVVTQRLAEVLAVLDAARLHPTPQSDVEAAIAVAATIRSTWRDNTHPAAAASTTATATSASVDAVIETPAAQSAPVLALEVTRSVSVAAVAVPTPIVVTCATAFVPRVIAPIKRKSAVQAPSPIPSIATPVLQSPIQPEPAAAAPVPATTTQAAVEVVSVAAPAVASMTQAPASGKAKGRPSAFASAMTSHTQAPLPTPSLSPSLVHVTPVEGSSLQQVVEDQAAAAVASQIQRLRTSFLLPFTSAPGGPLPGANSNGGSGSSPAEELLLVASVAQAAATTITKTSASDVRAAMDLLMQPHQSAAVDASSAIDTDHPASSSGHQQRRGGGGNGGSGSRNQSAGSAPGWGSGAVARGADIGLPALEFVPVPLSHMRKGKDGGERSGAPRAFRDGGKGRNNSDHAQLMRKYTGGATGPGNEVDALPSGSDDSDSADDSDADDGAMFASIGRKRARTQAHEAQLAQQRQRQEQLQRDAAAAPAAAAAAEAARGGRLRPPPQGSASAFDSDDDDGGAPDEVMHEGGGGGGGGSSKASGSSGGREEGARTAEPTEHVPIIPFDYAAARGQHQAFQPVHTGGPQGAGRSSHQGAAPVRVSAAAEGRGGRGGRRGGRGARGRGGRDAGRPKPTLPQRPGAVVPGRGGRGASGGRGGAPDARGGARKAVFNPYDIPDEHMLKAGKRSAVMPRSGNKVASFK